MSQLKKTVLKMGVLGLVLWGGYSWINQSPERAEMTAVTTDKVIETTLDKSDLALDASGEWIDDKVVLASDAWDRVDIKGKVSDLQSEAKPIGKIIKQKVDPNNIPGVKAAGWMDNKTSFPAMLLLLVAGVMLSMMALASPSSLSGGRH
ncbi:hypothetical protein [Hellea balneolensis]|uniref:hypothetical protein n=1 Tax=Hellea balneolensis TaxID=287478 RepID=UPI0004172CB2|nr:hypothetical protein [Hellea balneolensis]